MKRLVSGLILALLFIAAPMAQAQPGPAARPPIIPAKAFADTPQIGGAVVSPDGKQIALRANAEDKTIIGIFDAASLQMRQRLEIPKEGTLEWFQWAGNSRVLVSLSSRAFVYKVTRLYVYDLPSQAFTFIGKRQMGISGDTVIWTSPDGQYVLLALQRDLFSTPAVWRMPLDGTASASGVEVQPAKDDVWQWFADSGGNVRMGVEFQTSGKLKFWYRSTPQEQLRAIGKVEKDKLDDAFPQFVVLEPGSDQGFMLRKQEDGFVALQRFNYATMTVGETVHAVPGHDIEDVNFDSSNHLVSISYTDDRQRTVWFDKTAQAVEQRLAKALAGKDVRISSRAEDGSRMTVWVSHEDDPGQLYVYDAAKGQLAAFISAYPSLDPAQLAVPGAIAFKARDGTTIHGYLTLPRGRAAKGLPLVILPHGGPYGIRDTLDFDAEAQFLANRGYAVLQPNFRGSGGYGEAFDELGRGQVGRAMQDDLDDAMDWLVGQGIADPGRVCVVGSSYGGYAALWAVIRNPERYRCAASFAGVTDFKKILKYDTRFFDRKGNKQWQARVRGESSFNLDLVSPARQAARLTRPVLLAHGDKDTTVPFDQFSDMKDAAQKAGKPIEDLVFKDEGHGFDKPADFQKWLETLEAFLAKHNPAD